MNSPNYFIKPNDKISASLMENEVNEESIIKYIKGSTKTHNNLLLDTGSNIGLITCEVGNQFKYIEVYEKSPLCFNFLKSNATMSLNKNYRIREYALGENNQDVAKKIYNI